MNVEDKIKWEVKRLDNGKTDGTKVVITGTIDIYSKMVLQDPMQIDVLFTKARIEDDLKKLLKRYANMEKECNDAYLRGYQDALNGFVPKCKEA